MLPAYTQTSMPCLSKALMSDVCWQGVPRAAAVNNPMGQAAPRPQRHLGRTEASRGSPAGVFLVNLQLAPEPAHACSGCSCNSSQLHSSEYCKNRSATTQLDSASDRNQRCYTKLHTVSVYAALAYNRNMSRRQDSSVSQVAKCAYMWHRLTTRCSSGSRHSVLHADHATLHRQPM